MSNHSNNHKNQTHHNGSPNIHPVDSPSLSASTNRNILEPEVMMGPSPSGLASGLAAGGKLPAVRERLRSRLSAALARIETSAEQIAQTAEAEAVLTEQWAAEQAERYQETVKFFRSQGS